MKNTFDSKRDELLSELQDILDSAEQLVEEGGEVSADQLKKLKKQLVEKTEGYREQLDDLRTKATDKARAAIKQSDELIQDNPYKTIGIVAGVAFLAGLLINRSK
ncbi:DUF883 family protein [Spirabiliibacterium falconis]|uniref:DUF883 family protein n=1 Tax=Spirabiliibacterium falconis TaxID=572023 RepID=UPI001AAD3839|nr:DUF883 family protein [Spirabiliibacterium falconis]MBE2894278.1 DUF883 domain-containing protein [Spirabiliibacterium falconis]